MATVLVHLKTKDYASWRKVFDDYAEGRKQSGLTNFHILRSSDDPNEVFVQSETSDSEKAKAFLSSPDIRSAMQTTLAGPPEVHILNEV